MTEVLAVVEGPPTESLVMTVAAAIGSITHSPVRPLSFAKGLSEDRRAELTLGALDEPGVVVAVAAAQQSARALCWHVVSHARKPVVLVPPLARLARAAIGRVLVPLDGSSESSEAVAGTVELLAKAGVDLVVLHVFDAATAPRFWDQIAYAPRSWAEEFLTRHVSAAGVRLELRTGLPGEQVVDVAKEENADLIAMGWSQHLDGERAKTVRGSVLGASVPVLLVPVGVAVATAETSAD